jgi:Ca2+-binding RTX toxin-like protein
MQRQLHHLARRGVILLALFLGMMAHASRAEALQVRNNPFGNRPTTIVVGSIDNDIWLLHTASASECRWEHIGDLDNGIFDELELNGGNGDDTMIIMGSDPDSELFICGFPMKFAITYGTRIKLNGRRGNDYLEGGFDRNELYGGDGNDYLLSAYHTAILSGGAGNDTLITWGLFAAETILGGSGTDCVFDESGGAAQVNCGGQSGDRSNVPSSTCPIRSTTCP